MKLSEFLEKCNATESDIRKTLSGNKALKAVESDGNALQYVKDQTEAICLKAVESDGYALRYVEITVFEHEKQQMVVEN